MSHETFTHNPRLAAARRARRGLGEAGSRRGASETRGITHQPTLESVCSLTWAREWHVVAA